MDDDVALAAYTGAPDLVQAAGIDLVACGKELGTLYVVIISRWASLDFHLRGVMDCFL